MVRRIAAPSMPALAAGAAGARTTGPIVVDILLTNDDDPVRLRLAQVGTARRWLGARLLTWREEAGR